MSHVTHVPIWNNFLQKHKSTTVINHNALVIFKLLLVLIGRENPKTQLVLNAKIRVGVNMRAMLWLSHLSINVFINLSLQTSAIFPADWNLA
jgi:hypothetical protein